MIDIPTGFGGIREWVKKLLDIGKVGIRKIRNVHVVGWAGKLHPYCLGCIPFLEAVANTLR